MTLGNFGFYPVSSKLRHTLTLLTTTGVIAVGASDESRAGQETFKPTPSWERVLPTESDEEPELCSPRLHYSPRTESSVVTNGPNETGLLLSAKS